jgi:hypothetical protein
MTRRIEALHLAGTEQYGQRQLVIKSVIKSKARKWAVATWDP